jgi:hypothetical protein
VPVSVSICSPIKSYEARLDVVEELQQLGPLQASEDDEAAVFDHGVNLKDRLGQIQADHGNLLQETVPSVSWQ